MMGMWQFLSKFTVLKHINCSAPFLVPLNLLRLAGSLLPLSVSNVWLFPTATWATEVEFRPVLTLSERNPDVGPTAAIAPASNLLNSPFSLATLPEIGPALFNSVPEAVSVTLPVAKSTSKATFLQAERSRKAADLLGIPSQTAWNNEARYRAPEATPEWIVAATQLPVLTQPVDPPAIESLDTPGGNSRSPSTATGSSAFTVAADPANLELPPILECRNPDPELGCILLQNPPPGTQPAPILYLTPRVDFFRSNNLLLGIDPINAGLIRPNLTLLAIPRLGRNTFLLATVDGAFNRYFEVPQFSYDELRIRAGILQQLSPTMTAEVGWTNQQLFIANNEIPGFPSGTRFLNDQAVRFELSRRDQLNTRLSLNSIYQFRVSFSDPEDRSRILNVLFLSLNYDLNPNRTVQLGLDYQFSAANYTVVKRTDVYQQLLGRMTFNAFRNSQLSLYGGVSFGDSTERGINFNSYVLGVSMSVNWALF
jgi:hypothetical protein